MKISARDRLTGKISAVNKGATTARVRIGLKAGQEAFAIIKASDVMVY